MQKLKSKNHKNNNSFLLNIILIFSDFQEPVGHTITFSISHLERELGVQFPGQPNWTYDAKARHRCDSSKRAE